MSPARLFFEDFELRADSGELFKEGVPVKLQPQPAKVLELLAGRAGQVVSREEIREAVWGESYVDFDASLNFCIKEIRRALGDSATAPRFVETVPRKGYRFLAPVKEEKATQEQAPPVPLPPPAQPPPPPRRWAGLGSAGLAIGFLVLLTVLLGNRLNPVPPATGSAQEKATPSGPANEAYLKGVYLLEHEQYDEAKSRFQEAVLLDPGFARAYSKLAQAQCQVDPQTDIEVIETTVRHALELDSGLADAHSLLSEILLHHYLDWDGANEEIQKALELDPKYAEAYRVHAVYLMSLGRRAEAIATIRQARELDPGSMMVGANYAWYFYLDHQYDEAIRQARAVLKLYTASAAATPQAAVQGLVACHDTILLSALMLGDQETALASAQALLEIASPGKKVVRLRNLDEYWREKERALQEQLLTRDVSSYQRAKTAMLAGKRDRALDLLSRCEPPEKLSFPFAPVEPVFDSLHGDPRWARVLDCLKLPADAPARHPNR